MSTRLDRAERFRRDASSVKLEAAPIRSHLDLMKLGAAGAAVCEVYEFCKGIAHAFAVPAPSLLDLAPLAGECSLAWCDRCIALMLKWRREWLA